MRAHVDEVLLPVYDVDEIWHYSAAGPALSILRNQRIFASSVAMLNDSGELAFGIDILMDAFERRSRQEDYSFMDEIREILAGGFNMARARSGFFVACASMLGDSLSQFRAYGSYALALNPRDNLTPYEVPAADDDPPHIQTQVRDGFLAGWRPVMYVSDRDDNDDFEDTASRLFTRLDSLSERAEAARAEGNFNEADVQDASARTLFITVAAHIKHSAFGDEHEVRYFGQIPLTSRPVQLRDSRLGITPYVELGNNEQTHIVTAANVGPGLPDTDAAIFGLKSAATHLRLPDFEVWATNYPAR